MDAAQTDGEKELLRSAVEQSGLSIVLTDPRLHDNPITYVNDAFQRLTLYSRDYALGRNCRFLQGPLTDPARIQEIRDGLASGGEFQVSLINHRADGTAFRNELLITPIRDEDGTLNAYFAVQRLTAEVSESGAVQGEDGTLSLLRELQHRVKNHLAMIVSMVRLQANRDVTPESLRAVSRRIEALALLYEELCAVGLQDGPEEIEAGAYLSRIANVISGIEVSGAIRVNVECEAARLPVDQAARLGLLLSELLTNALEHAFPGREVGAIAIRFGRDACGTVRLVVEDDGVGLPEGSRWPYGAKSIETQRARAADRNGPLDTTGHDGRAGVGGSIVVALTETVGAELDIRSGPDGTRVAVEIRPEG